MASSLVLGASAFCVTSVLPLMLFSVLQYISMMRAVNALGKSPLAALGLGFLCQDPTALPRLVSAWSPQSSYAPVFVVAQAVHPKAKQTLPGKCRFTRSVLKDLHSVT